MLINHLNGAFKPSVLSGYFVKSFKSTSGVAVRSSLVGNHYCVKSIGFGRAKVISEATRLCKIHTALADKGDIQLRDIYEEICSKTCVVGLLIRSIFSEKIARARQRQCSFSSEKLNESIQTNKTCLAFITHLLSIRATISWQKLINNKFETQTLTGNSTGNSRCHALASRALNMSCSFGQSARSI